MVKVESTLLQEVLARQAAASPRRLPCGLDTYRLAIYF
jgi:hypothetical protein